MAELRSVDPRILQPNPDNPRRTPVSPAMDEQLLASIKAIGIIQPPIVVEKDGALVINAGDRRVKQAIRAHFATIDAVTHYHALQIQDFLRAIIEDRPPRVTGDDGRRVVELFQAIYQSDREARSIRLPIT